MSNKTERFDKMGDRMKAYERIETEQRFKPNSILHVRLDGRGFSKFTKGLQRPYDERLSTLMVDTAKHVLERFKCVVGYTQSDEMSFILVNDYETPCDFDAKKQKLLSSFSATATAFFNANLASRIPEKAGYYPEFDCRIFEVPNESEATNSILWREKDAIKNSVSMLAQHYFSHKELQKKSAIVMKDMLKTQKDVIWDDMPRFFKSGTILKRELYLKTNAELKENCHVQYGIISIRSRTIEVDSVLNNMEHEERVKLVMSKNIDNSQGFPNNNNRVYDLSIDWTDAIPKGQRFNGTIEHPKPIGVK